MSPANSVQEDRQWGLPPTDNKTAPEQLHVSSGVTVVVMTVSN